MTGEFSNVYEDDDRADAYAELEFPGTYYLAYRDLPEILRDHVRGRRALDFGCGTGRSTRFLRQLGFDAVGVDIAEPMVARARERDPKGDYRLVADDDLSEFASGTYDLVLSAFTFDNIPTIERKVATFRALDRLTAERGRIVSVVSAPEIYVNEWASFSTQEFPGNREAASGDTVRIVMLDVEDRRPVEDILWTDEDYQRVYGRAGLTPIHVRRPLASPNEPYSWVSETSIAPWVVYVLGGTQRCRGRQERGARMADLKTKRTKASVDAFLRGVEDDARRKDCRELCRIMCRVTGAKAEMWGDSIVGFGTYHYKYASGREGDWMLAGFSPRKRDLTVYILAGFSRFEEVLSRLGKHSKTKSCLHIKRLADVDLAALEELVSASVEHMKQTYG